MTSNSPPDGWRVRETSEQVTGDHLVLIEPVIETRCSEDDLETELKKSSPAGGRPGKAGLGDARRRGVQDCHECEVALQTLATTDRASAKGRVFDAKKWGEVAAYLRTSGLITKEEEEGLCGVFTFLSPGATV
jgi:hypothetical protein